MDQLNGKLPDLGVWSSLVIRYAVTANSNNTPQQSTPGYKETSKLVPGTSPPAKVSKSENHYIHNINVTIQACYTVSLWMYHWH